MTPYIFSEGTLGLPIVGPVLRFIIGDRIGAEQMQSMNALLVMLMVPIFTYVLFPVTEKSGLRVTTLRRMGAGLFLTAISFVMVAIPRGQKSMSCSSMILDSARSPTGLSRRRPTARPSKYPASCSSIVRQFP